MRGPIRAKSRKMRKSHHRKLTLNRLVKQVKSLKSNVEIKNLNNYLTLAGSLTSGNPRGVSFFLTNGTGAPMLPAQGSAYNNRIGNNITVKRWKLLIAMYSPNSDQLSSSAPNVIAYASNGATTTTAPVAAIYDPCGNRAQFRFIVVSIRGDQERLYSGDNLCQRFVDRIGGFNLPTYHRDMDEAPFHEYKVLADKTFSVSNNDKSAGSEIIHLSGSFPHGHKVIYDQTDTMIMGGDIQLLCFCDINNSSNAWGIYPGVQFFYADS